MKFKLSPNPGATPPPAGQLFTEREQRKMLIMSALFVAVAGGMIWGWISGRNAPPPETTKHRGDEAPASQLVTPTFRVDELRAAVKDATQSERGELETRALGIALADSRLYSAVHFEPLGGVELDAQRAAELLASPDAARGRVFRVRGRLRELIQYPESPEAGPHYRGLLALDDGALVHVAFQSCVEYEFGAEDYVRIDGMFVKNLGRSLGGAWVDAPLVVGPRAQRSYPALGPVTSLSAADFAADLGALDDAATAEREEYWRVVSYTRDVDQSKVDWSKAPLLDRATMALLSESPERYLALPIRIPPCRVQDIWTQKQGENPARIAVLTEGWIGANEWLQTPNPVIQFSSLVPDPGFKIGSEITARGYFVRMNEYEAVGGTRRAPVFVLTALQPYVMPTESVFGTVLYAVGASFMGIVALFWFLLRRDRQKAEALDEELRRRRRARRTQASSANA